MLRLILIVTCAFAAPFVGAADATPLRVAVLDFDAEMNRTYGPKLADLLVAELSEREPAWVLLERSKIAAVLKEASITAVKVSTLEDAKRVTSLISADVLITGRCYKVGDDLWISFKFLNTATARFEGAIAKNGPHDDTNAQVSNLADVLEEKMAGKKSGRRLIEELKQLHGQISKRPKLGLCVDAPQAETARKLISQVQSSVLFALNKAGAEVNLTASESIARWKSHTPPGTYENAENLDALLLIELAQPNDTYRISLIDSKSGQEIFGRPGSLAVTESENQIELEMLSAIRDMMHKVFIDKR